MYEKAGVYFEAKEYDNATSTYKLVLSYLDSSELADLSQYKKAEDLFIKCHYEEAIAVWEKISSYSDSKNRIIEAQNAWSESDYRTAQALMDDGRYLEASEAFAALGTYKDSTEKAEECINLKHEEDYQCAMLCVENEDYPKAIELFHLLEDYSDALEQYLATVYAYAMKLTDEKEYKEAIGYFSLIPSYEKSDSLMTTAVYNYGCQLLDGKDYSAALIQFGKCRDYKDAKRKMLDAKYGYVTLHKSNTGTTTYNYLKELVDSGYSGAKSIYNELYAWTVNIYAINNRESDDSTYSSQLSKYDTWYFHLKLEGGTPSGGSEQLYYKFTYPDGSSSGKKAFGSKWGRGDSGVVCAWWDQPQYGASGTLTFTVYDSNGNNIGSASVSIK